METNLYTITVPPFLKALDNLSKILDKAAAHAASKATERRPASYFEQALLNDRLIFDQFPLLMQVQRVSDNAKGGPARLARPQQHGLDDGAVGQVEQGLVRAAVAGDVHAPLAHAHQGRLLGQGPARLRGQDRDLVVGGDGPDEDGLAHLLPAELGQAEGRQGRLDLGRVHFSR